MLDMSQAFRVLPRVTPENEHFWRGGADGQLRISRCGDCGTWIHPTSPICPSCYGRSIAPDVASGKATVFTFTINQQPWIPSFDPPYVVAIVALPEQDGLRLTTNVTNVEPDDVFIGMPVRVVFEHRDEDGYEVWLPLFEPDPDVTATGGGAR